MSTEEDVCLWYALRAAVAEHPGLGVTAIGAKPETVEDTVRVTISGKDYHVLLVPVLPAQEDEGSWLG